MSGSVFADHCRYSWRHNLWYSQYTQSSIQIQRVPLNMAPTVIVPISDGLETTYILVYKVLISLFITVSLMSKLSNPRPYHHHSPANFTVESLGANLSKLNCILTLVNGAPLSLLGTLLRVLMYWHFFAATENGSNFKLSAV